MAYQATNGAAVTIRHPVRDIAGALVTGQAGAITKALSDPAIGAPAISVTVVEVGTTGWYLLTFTPNVVGIWVLTVTNPVPLVADGATTEYSVDVLSGVVAAVSGLTTLDRLKRRIGKVETDVDVLLGEIISEISSDVEMRCGRSFGEQAYTHYMSGDGTARLVLPQGPLVSVASVDLVTYSDVGGVRTETLTAVLPPVYVELGARSLNSDGPGVLQRLGSTWPWGLRNVKIGFTAGYSSLPEQLVGQATTACAAVFFSREAAGLRSKTEGEYSVDVLTPAQLDAALDRMAAPYRYDWGLS